MSERNGRNGSHPERLFLDVGPEGALLAGGLALIAVACASKEKHTKTFIGGLILLTAGTFAIIGRGKRTEYRPSIQILNKEEKIKRWEELYRKKTA